jgi:anti-sigma regulatory factor (Ser/Thr protein kinase)
VTVEILTLPALAHTVPEARRFVRRALLSLDADGACDDAEALVSELATNAVLHAQTEYTIQVTREGSTVRVRVHDRSAVLPRQRAYGSDATTGRGLRLVASIASAWGCQRDRVGKALWFDLPAQGSTSSVPTWGDEMDVNALLATLADEDDHGQEAPAAWAMAA